MGGECRESSLTCNNSMAAIMAYQCFSRWCVVLEHIWTSSVSFSLVAIFVLSCVRSVYRRRCQDLLSQQLACVKACYGSNCRAKKLLFA